MLRTRSASLEDSGIHRNSNFIREPGGNEPGRGGIYGLLWSVGLVAACGGKVVVDGAGSGGASGNSTVSSATTTGVSNGETTTTTADQAASSSSNSSGASSCDNTGICVDLGDGPSCFACAVQGPCFDLVTACTNNSDCAACDKCLQFCANDDCVQACYAEHPFGAPIYYSMFTCMICDTCHNDCKSLKGIPPICK